MLYSQGTVRERVEWNNEYEKAEAGMQTEWRRRQAAEARVTELEAALNEAIELAIWMSGASAFGPDGEAGEAWPAQRERLYAAMKVRDVASSPAEKGTE